MGREGHEGVVRLIWGKNRREQKRDTIIDGAIIGLCPGGRKEYRKISGSALGAWSKCY